LEPPTRQVAGLRVIVAVPLGGTAVTDFEAALQGAVVVVVVSAVEEAVKLMDSAAD
jgi:hypothetical protein